MADYKARIAPFINVTFYVTSEFGEPRPGRSPHKGLDIATPKPGNNLYSMVNGKIYYKAYDADGFGHYIIIKENISGLGFLYGHMREECPLKVGDSVIVGQYVGHEGTTGSSIGVHLHLEMQNIKSNEWKFGADLSEYINPAEFMGFPNKEGISVFYDGVLGPAHKKRKKFKWVLYTKKLREKY